MAMLGTLRTLAARSERDEDQTSHHEADRRGQQGDDERARRTFRHDRLCDEEGKPDCSGDQSPTLPDPGTWSLSARRWQLESAHNVHRALVLCILSYREPHTPCETEVRRGLFIKNDRSDSLGFESDSEALDIAD
jgi:hypothetical protein